MSVELCPNDLQLGMDVIWAMHLLQDHKEASRMCGNGMWLEMML